MAVEVFVADEQTDHALDHLRWLHLAEKVLAAEGVRGDAELSVLFVDEQAMSRPQPALPRLRRPHRRAGLPDRRGAVRGRPQPRLRRYRSGLHAGRAGRSADAARRRGHLPGRWRRGTRPSTPAPIEDEIALLLVHGILHLMGMDHDDDEEAEAMEAREGELLDHSPASAAGFRFGRTGCRFGRGGSSPPPRRRARGPSLSRPRPGPAPTGTGRHRGRPVRPVRRDRGRRGRRPDRLTSASWPWPRRP